LRGWQSFRDVGIGNRLIGFRLVLGLSAQFSQLSTSMSSHRILPPAPRIQLELVEDLTPEQPKGFCRLVRQRLLARADRHPHHHAATEPFVYDWLERRALDAVVVIAYYFDAQGVPWVYLRSATRPPVAKRDPARIPRSEWLRDEGLWEVTAGLVEDDEETPEGLVRCACRELEEELGFTVDSEVMLPLGPSTLPAPGIIGERHFFFRVEVNPQKRAAPSLDGSALEQLGTIIEVPLADALSACRSGEVEDAKTELGLRRLAEALGNAP
jgi:ADP-ribose pyrophosphatase